MSVEVEEAAVLSEEFAKILKFLKTTSGEERYRERGRAIDRIIKEKMFRQLGLSFVSFCTQELKCSDSDAYQVRNAAKFADLVEEMLPGIRTPGSEYSVRELLARVKADEGRLHCWKITVERVQPKEPTHVDVHDTLVELGYLSTEKRTRRPKADGETEDKPRKEPSEEKDPVKDMVSTWTILIVLYELLREKGVDANEIIDTAVTKHAERFAAFPGLPVEVDREIGNVQVRMTSKIDPNFGVTYKFGRLEHPEPIRLAIAATPTEPEPAKEMGYPQMLARGLAELHKAWRPTYQDYDPETAEEEDEDELDRIYGFVDSAVSEAGLKSFLLATPERPRSRGVTWDRFYYTFSFEDEPMPPLKPTPKAKKSISAPAIVGKAIPESNGVKSDDRTAIKRRIFELKKKGHSDASIGKTLGREFGKPLSQPMISKIRNGHSWADVPV